MIKLFLIPEIIIKISIDLIRGEDTETAVLINFAKRKVDGI